ncbi:hypothetical protein ACE38W_04055 [Chitinophaga sp. Hz27]|uniref:hypothetical protein n=1 Tax=Chitinophaga sp. Hz27 TaxID=3347169 RepID=UPI0035E193EF
MRIVFGARTIKIKSQEFTHIECPKCGGKHLVGAAFRRYFHLYWIPVFSSGTDVELKCVQCREDLYSEDVDKQLNQFKYYWYTFIWLYLLGALILYCFLASLGLRLF